MIAAVAHEIEYSTSKKSDFAPPVFRVIVRPAYDAGGYAAVCDMDKGGCVAQGETLQETQKMIMESVDFYLEDYPEIKNYFIEFEYCDA